MANQKMLAVRLHEYGGADKLVVEEVERPQPQTGQVLVRLAFAGVNPADWKMREGYYQKFMPLPFPWIPGMEGAGTVEAVGEGVNTLQPGQAVFGLINSAYAQYAVAPASDLSPKPAALSLAQAATVPVGALTAWQAVIEEAGVQAGQRVLVQGGAGGVGLFAVQLARWRGAHVIATTSGPNVEFVRGLGAETVIDYRTTRVEEVVKDLDAVIDTVGGDLVARSVPLIKPGGIFVTVAAMVDPELGESRGIRATSSRRADTACLAEISGLLSDRQLVPEVGKVFPLAQARQAQELSQTGHGRGRILLQM